MFLFKKNWILAVLLLNVCGLSAQELTFELKLENPQVEILDDGKATVTNIQGGQAPYTYYWSQQSTPLTSAESTGLREGKTYTVKVTDATGVSVEESFEVSPESINEKINSAVTPIVVVIESVIMGDLFYALGLYDNVIYDAEDKPIKHPNGDNRRVAIPLVAIWLLFGAIFFTISLRFINFRGMRHAYDLIRGRFDDPNDKGEVSHFQALTTALSGTVGLGNIAGVAVAVSVGGAGATFWLIVAGLFGMASKFVECTLAVKYREIDEHGEVHGGPMYYLKKGLAKQGKGKLGSILAVIFAVLCIGGSFGGGNMFQANQAFSQMANLFPVLSGHGFWFGIVFALLVGVVIIGGIKSIANVTDKIVPFMVGIYVLFSLIIIFMNINHIGDAFSEILSGAFSNDALKGGFIGILITGLRRAAFSNEAGVGSAAIAHSASKTDEPVSEGTVALLEPFVDTVVVCTMTALVLIFTGAAHNTQGLEGAELTSYAFSTQFSWFKYVLTVAIVLFAFSTMVSWSYYGVKAFTFLFGRKKSMDLTYKALFLIFTVIGSSIGMAAVIDFSDYMILGMAFPNVLGIYFMMPEVFRDVKSYFARIKSDEITKHEVKPLMESFKEKLGLKK